jgi:catechol 2,3-dioxygenase-like lactoylglutathione lyase family enzyme
MKIHILGLAVGDLEAGRDFYERQQPGLGVYFLDTLFSDIEALLLYAGVHAQVFGYFRALSKSKEQIGSDTIT